MAEPSDILGFKHCPRIRPGTQELKRDFSRLGMSRFFNMENQKGQKFFFFNRILSAQKHRKSCSQGQEKSMVKNMIFL